MASTLSEDVISAAIKQAAVLQRSQKLVSLEGSLVEEDRNCNSNYEFGDFSRSIDLSSSPLPHQPSQDLLGVDLDQFLKGDRRRSSNLSDLASRRSSSSCSAKYSSEFSSEFEEYYESFQKQEQKHGTIKEEVGSSCLHEFASVLATKLLQEISTTAPQSSDGHEPQTFDNIPLPRETKKPIPLRTPVNISDETSQSTTIPYRNISSSSEMVENLDFGVVETLARVARREVDQFYHSSENNNLVSRIELENELSQRKKSSPYIFDESRTDLDEELAKKSPSTLPGYASSLSRIILNMGLYDLAKNQPDCEVCRERACCGDTRAINETVVDSIIEKSHPEIKYHEAKDGISPEEVKTARIGLILAEKIVNQIMVDLRVEFLRGTLDISSFQQCDLGTSEVHVCPSPVEDISTDTVMFLKPEQAKDDIRSGRDSKTKAIDFCDIVDVRQTPYEQPTLEEEMFSYAQAFTDNIISEACRELNRGWILKSHSRRSSEPSQKTNSIQAFIGIDKPSMSVSGKKILRRHYHNSFSMEMSRWHSSEEVSQRKHGFKDETLSSFDELLQRSTSYIPNLELFENPRRDSLHSEHGSSRRSSCSGFRDSLLASFEEELILTSADKNASVSSSSSSKCRSKSLSKSSTSLSPRSNHCGHSGKPLRTNSCPERDPEQDIVNIAADCPELSAVDLQIGLDSLAADLVKTVTPEELFVDACDIPFNLLEHFSIPLCDNILSSALLDAASIVKSKQLQDYKRRMRPIATGNWGCGVFGGDPQLKAMIQWAAASLARAPALMYFTFGNEQMQQLGDVQAAVRGYGWTVGDLMDAVKSYCDQTLEEADREQLPDKTLFQYLLNKISIPKQTLQG